MFATDTRGFLGQKPKPIAPQRPKRLSPSLLILSLVAVSLSACQSAPTPVQAPTSTVSSSDYANLPAGVTPKNFRLPTEKGCSGDIARFRAVIDNDLASGHTTDKVNQEIHAELDKIGKTCTPGHDSEASTAVRALKSRYGYPSGN